MTDINDVVTEAGTDATSPPVGAGAQQGCDAPPRLLLSNGDPVPPDTVDSAAEKPDPPPFIVVHLERFRDNRGRIIERHAYHGGVPDRPPDDLPAFFGIGVQLNVKVGNQVAQVGVPMFLIEGATSLMEAFEKYDAAAKPAVDAAFAQFRQQMQAQQQPGIVPASMLNDVLAKRNGRGGMFGNRRKPR